MRIRHAAPLSLALFLGAMAPALAYDFVKDALIGNTVVTTNTQSGRFVTFRFRADGSVTRADEAQQLEMGVWFETPQEVCATFAMVNDGERMCTPKPKETIAVPGERLVTFAGVKGQPPVTVKIQYRKGQ